MYSISYLLRSIWSFLLATVLDDVFNSDYVFIFSVVEFSLYIFFDIIPIFVVAF